MLKMQALRAQEYHVGLAEEFKRVSELRMLKVLSYSIKVFLFILWIMVLLKDHVQSII